MDPDLTLGDVLADVMDELGDMTTPTDREYAHAGVVFATRPSENVIELRLGEEIGEAAMRTPDTQPSARGPDWVRFAPAQWDEHAVDRLEAWFRVAWRMAGSKA